MSAQAVPVLEPPASRVAVPIARDLLDESPTNARRTWGNLDELADSIRRVGILQALLVRPSPSKPGAFEIVFGHRRGRAAELAELAQLPCEIRVMTDEEVAEVQAIENLQRADLSPLEEAENFEQLLTLGWTAEQVGARLGKSRAFVYGRLKLLALVQRGRELCYSGWLNVSVAEALARVPKGLQLKALADLFDLARATQHDADALAEDLADGEVAAGGRFVSLKDGVAVAGDRCDPPPFRAAAALLRRKYTLPLAGAPFERGDAQLVPAAGACPACPKRTGNQAVGLVVDEKPSPDVCTDPECYAAKTAAAVAIVTARLEAKGADVLEARTDRWGRKAPPAGYVTLKDVCYEAGGKSFGELAKQKKVAKVLEAKGTAVMLDAKNRPVELVKKSVVIAAAGVKTAAKKRGSRQIDWEQQGRALEAVRKAEDAARTKAVSGIMGKLTTPSPALLRTLLAAEDLEHVGARRNWQAKRNGGRSAFGPALAKLDADDLVLVLLEALLVDCYDETFAEACALFRLDFKAMCAAELADLKRLEKQASTGDRGIATAAKVAVDRTGKKAKKR